MRGDIVLCMDTHHTITYLPAIGRRVLRRARGRRRHHPESRDRARNDRRLRLLASERFARISRHGHCRRRAVGGTAGVRKLDVTAARDTLQFLEAFRPVLDRIRALADSLEFTMKSRRASLTADALQIYAIAKAVGRDPRGAAVASHVEHLKRDLGRRGPARKQATTLRGTSASFAGATCESPRADPGSRRMKSSLYDASLCREDAVV
jgi:hypothetical protein